MARHHRYQGFRFAAAVVLLALTLAGCNQSAKPANSPPAKPSRPPVPVEVVEVRPATFLETVRGVGTVRAKASVEVRPEISGVVQGIHFREGEEVERGALLFMLDDRQLRHQLAERKAALKAAQAKLENARRVYSRAEELFERRVASQADLDQALADLRAAEAEINRLEAEIGLTEERLADTRIAAPMEGVTSRRMVDVGDYVKEGELLVSLFQISTVEVAVNVPERFAGHVRMGQPAEILVQAFPDRPFEGEVTFVSPEIDERTRAFLVKISVSNPDRHLRPGAFATAALTVDVLENRPAVPEEALVATSEGYFVFIVNGHKARFRQVEVGHRRTGLAEIREGLALGELVVRHGHMQLADGATVRIVETGDAPHVADVKEEEARP